ncbi:caspase family protein [Streptomyces sp. NPDC102409]|uniref:caspase family protein n=1 Tax=Streptomyces sp. NPDC102409 TaxID=3366172 RepID=UPI0037F9EA0A
MIRHKALLIGASEYDDPAIAPLPFVPGDLERMKMTLLGRGFSAVEIASSRRGITPNFVNGKVTDFLWRAQSGDALLVMLSGHGVHFEGADYLVPEDSYLSSSSIDKSCIKIDWVKELENSPAGQIVFLIDACREGIDRSSMAPPPGVRQWGNRKVAASLRRKVAYVYACSPAQVALFVRASDVRSTGDNSVASGESFSIFSRAVSDLVSDASLANLEEFEEAVQERIEATHRNFGKSGVAQRIRIVTDVDKRSFSILPGALAVTDSAVQLQTRPDRGSSEMGPLVGVEPGAGIADFAVLSRPVIGATPPSPHPPRPAPPPRPSAKRAASPLRGSASPSSQPSTRTTAPSPARKMGLTPTTIEPTSDFRSPAHRTERELLKLALQKPDLVPEFDGYAESEFTAAPYSAVYRCISAVGGVKSRQGDYLARIRNSAANDRVRDLLFELMVEPMLGKKIGRSYAGMQLVQVRIRAVQRRIDELQAEFARLKGEPAEATTKLMEETWKLQQYLQSLRQTGIEAL